jgi:hypothetical protein
VNQKIFTYDISEKINHVCPVFCVDPLSISRDKSKTARALFSGYPAAFCQKYDRPTQFLSVSMEDFSAFIPRWLQKLSNPACKTVLFYGCGGGFDFTHCILLIPSLVSSGKRVVILSNSFTNVSHAYSSSETYYCDPLTGAVVKRIKPNGPGEGYVLEQAVVDFFADRFPDVVVYANNVHVISPAGIAQTLANLIADHSVDVLVTIDGGTDSLMRGDEEDYATIIEDFVSLAILENLREATPRLQDAMLLVVGFGVDRFHGASDAASLRAVAELTRMGGFLGVSSIDQASIGFATYTDFLLFYRRRYGAESGMQALVGPTVAAATVGQYGPYQSDVVPKDVPRNVGSKKSLKLSKLGVEDIPRNTGMEEKFRRYYTAVELKTVTFVSGIVGMVDRNPMMKQNAM